MFLLSRVQFILFVLFCALLWSTLLFPNQVFCATVDLTWDKPADTSSIAGYKIYTAYSGNSFPDEATKVIADSNETTCSIDGLTEGKTYGFAATSFDAEDNESTYSNTVYYTISESTTSIDADGDGLTDAEEEQYGLDPNNPDTNGNGIPDKDVVHLWGNAWDGDIDGDGTMNLFDLDADGDGVCDATELLHGKDPSDPSDNPSGLPPMVFGEVPVGQEWTTVELNKTFQYPVVVVGPLSLNDQEPAVVRTQNIHSQGFDIRLQEYEYQDGPHAQEQVSFLVMEMGSYYLPDGTRIEASYFDTQAMYSDFDTIPFNSPFQTQPVVTASIATFNGQRPVTGRIHNLSTQGFDYSLQEEEDSALDHEQESVAYIAWEPSNGEIDGTQFEVEFAKNITHEKKAISFQKPFTASPSILSSMQSCLEGDTANLRIAEQKNDELTVQVHEEKSLDTEHSHIDEDIGYIALAQNTNTLAVNFQPADAEVPEGYEVDSGEALDSSTKYGWVTVPGVPRDRNQWISFDQAYDTMIHVSPSSVWEAKLPNGTYAVTVCMGDPSWPNGMQNVQVENLSLIEYESLSPDQRWIEETMTVEVYDGRLTVSFAGSDNPARLSWIKIVGNDTSDTSTDDQSTTDKTYSLPVNFQPGNAEAPAGYEVDSGEALDSSTKYGWVTVPGVPRDRNQWISFDQAYDTMIHVSPSSVWEAKLPNGTYAVTVCMGDPSWPNGMQNVQVENLSLIEYESLSPDQRWIEETMTVEVYDGRLTVSFAGSDNPARLCWIKISSTKQ